VRRSEPTSWRRDFRVASLKSRRKDSSLRRHPLSRAGRSSSPRDSSPCNRDLTGGGYGTPEDRAHNQANEITNRYPSGSPTPELPFNYDHGGNLRDAALSTNTKDVYTHDAWNRLVKAQREVTGLQPSTLAKYEYNGLHWRTLKRTTGWVDQGELQVMVDVDRRMYYSAAWQLLEEDIDEDGEEGIDRICQEAWGLRYIDDPVFRRVDHIAAEQIDEYYHLTDVQFSTRAMTGLGLEPRVLERVNYEAYGKGTHRWPADFDDDGDVDTGTNSDGAMLTAAFNTTMGQTGYNALIDLNRDGMIDGDDQTEFNLWSPKAALFAGDISDPAGPDNVFGWDGYVYDKESANYCVRFRWYSPVYGRWLERDPVGYRDGMNLFSYCSAAPAHLRDPFGLDDGIRLQVSFSNCDPTQQQRITAALLALPSLLASKLAELDTYVEALKASDLCAYNKVKPEIDGLRNRLQGVQALLQNGDLEWVASCKTLQEEGETYRCAVGGNDIHGVCLIPLEEYYQTDFNQHYISTRPPDLITGLVLHELCHVDEMEKSQKNFDKCPESLRCPHTIQTLTHGGHRISTWGKLNEQILDAKYECECEAGARARDKDRDKQIRKKKAKR
jgi:RHS repeat-associated protein